LRRIETAVMALRFFAANLEACNAASGRVGFNVLQQGAKSHARTSEGSKSIANR
jgi:hypothetical protein